MRWWIGSQHPVWAVGTAVIGTVVVIASPGSIALPIPALAGPTAFSAVRPFSLVAVLITVVAWASLSAGHKSAALSATRAMKVYVFLSICVVTASSLVLAAAWALIVGEVMVPLQLLLRNILGLFGLGLLLVPLTGYRYAGIVSTVYVFISAIFGRTNSGGIYDSAPWAWPVSESPVLDYWAPAILLFVSGGFIWLLRHRSPYSRIMIAQAMDSRRE